MDPVNDVFSESLFGTSNLQLLNRMDSCPPSPGCDQQISHEFLSADFDSSEIPPLSFDKSTTEEVPVIKPKRKYRTKPRNTETEKDKKTKRAENNRRAAKESRERKRMHVQTLENEVQYLKAQVEYYRAKFARYQLIDNQRNLFGFELYAAIANVHKELQENGKDFNNPAEFSKFMEERRKALEQLARIMVEIVSPLPQRFLFWAAENNLNFAEDKKGPLSAEDAKTVAEFLQTTFPDKRTYTETKVFFAACAGRIRGHVKQLLDCQRNIQTEVKKLGQYVYNNYIPTCHPYKAQALAQFASKIYGMRQLEDYALFNLKDTDFGTASSFSEKHSCKVK